MENNASNLRLKYINEIEESLQQQRDTQPIKGQYHWGLITESYLENIIVHLQLLPQDIRDYICLRLAASDDKEVLESEFEMLKQIKCRLYSAQVTRAYNIEHGSSNKVPKENK